MPKVTEKQLAVLGFVDNYFNYHQYSPTFREIAQEFSINVRAAYDHVQTLKRKGYLKVERGRSRSLRMAHSDSNQEKNSYITKIPVVTSLTISTFLQSSGKINNYVNMSGRQFITRDYFALYIEDNAMKDIGILGGDLVVVHYKSQFNNGDIVATYLNEQILVRRVVKQHSRMQLHPENDSFSVIYGRDFFVLGPVVVVSRSYRN